MSVSVRLHVGLCRMANDDDPYVRLQLYQSIRDLMAYGHSNHLKNGVTADNPKASNMQNI
jgi:hypothetical protein